MIEWLYNTSEIPNHSIIILIIVAWISYIWLVISRTTIIRLERELKKEISK